MAIGYDGGLTCSMGVTSLDRSIAWYRDVLGFTLLYRLDDIAWCELSTARRAGQCRPRRARGGGRRGRRHADLRRRPTSRRPRPSSTGTMSARTGRSATFPDMVRLLTFFDPDDNALMFYQELGEAHDQGA